MWLYIPLVVGFVLAIASFFIGLWPVGIVLLVACVFGLASKVLGAARQSRTPSRQDPTQPLRPAHEGQEHMTPDQIPSPRA